MEMSVDINEVKSFIESDNFSSFLLNNTTDLGTAAFVLQACFDKLREVEEGEN